MKVFKDLVFKKHRSGLGVHAIEKFANGFELSVVAGEGLYSTPREDKDSPDDFSAFEIAVFETNGDWATKQFVPDHHDDVLGWQDRGQINALMLLIQSKNKK